MERVPVPGTILQVERRGPLGRPLAFLHPGAGADHYALLPLTRFLRRSGYTTLVPDPRGIGGSGRPAGGYDVQTLAADALAVLDFYHAGRALLLGQSLGSAVVQQAALLAPERVSQLILLATWAKSDSFLARQFDLVRALVAPNPPEVYGSALLYLLVSRPYLLRSEDEIRGLLAGMFTGRRAPSKAILLAHLQAGQGHDTSASLPRLEVPTLVLSGERDMMLPKEYGEETAALLPQGRHILLQGARSSHLFHWEMTAEVEAILAGFLPPAP